MQSTLPSTTRLTLIWFSSFRGRSRTNCKLLCPSCFVRDGQRFAKETIKLEELPSYRAIPSSISCSQKFSIVLSFVHHSVIALPVTTTQSDSLVSTFFRSTRIQWVGLSFLSCHSLATTISNVVLPHRDNIVSIDIPVRFIIARSAFRELSSSYTKFPVEDWARSGDWLGCKSNNCEWWIQPKDWITTKFLVM